MAPRVNVDPQDITDRSRRELLRLLESVRGKKSLVLQRSLLGPIGLFLKFSTLQEYGVEKLFVLDNHNVETTQRNIVFLARGEKPNEVQEVAGAIKRIRQDSQNQHDFSIIWVPRRTLLSNRVLEENGVLGDANILSCPLSFIALEEDVLSLELEDAATDLYLRHDPTSIYMSAQAIMSIQRRSGLIPQILGKGTYAKQLADLLVRLREEEETTASAASTSGDEFLSGFGLVPSASIDSLIIIDRDVDFPSALLTQLTYAGLLDETFSTRYNQIEVSTSIIGPGPAVQSQQPQPANLATTTAQKRKVQLDASDALYPGLRDLNFATLGPTLNQRARALQNHYEARHKADASISDLKSFVSKLPSYQLEQASLKVHTSLAEEILTATRSDIFSKTLEVQQTLVASGDGAASAMHDRIEELIDRAVPLSTILRLLSLESSLVGGIRPRDLDNFKRQIYQAYGYEHLLTFSNLEKMGLIVPRTASNTAYLNPMAAASRDSPSAGRSNTDYSTVRTKLGLLVDDVDEEAQNDIAYVFSGYAPLSVRLVQCALHVNWPAAPDQPAAQQQPAAPTLPLAPRTPSWKGFEDVLARVRGPTVDVAQLGANEGASHARLVLRGSGGGNGNGDGAGDHAATRGHERTTTSIVFYLGGVTYAEIAALRLVGRKLREQSGGGNRRLVIATTGVIGGDRLVGSGTEGRKLN